MPNWACWLGRDSLALGGGAVSTIEGCRWRNTPRLGAYIQALEGHTRPARELEPLPTDVQRRERVMIGLRLDEPLLLDELAGDVDSELRLRLEQLALVEEEAAPGGCKGLLMLTR